MPKDEVTAIKEEMVSIIGMWEHDDENLRSRIRTEIGFYDDVDYKQAKVTSCDYSTAKGKAGIYEIKYVVKDDVDKEIELRRESRNFNINKYTNTHKVYEQCGCAEA